jgi:NAD-reducing hydrogenase small subunit
MTESPSAGISKRQVGNRMTTKPRVATVSLAGCFGCHMSILDIDERILRLADLVEFDRSPINDFKDFQGRCAVGIVEGGCCNEENVHVLEQFRKQCDALISLGECAINGGIPAMRNNIPLRECLEEAYVKSPGVYNPSGVIPNDPEIPLLLNRVYPCHEVVKIDHFIPGCPPSADTIWDTLVNLLTGKPLDPAYGRIKYD